MILNRKILVCCFLLTCLFVNMFSISAFSAGDEDQQIIKILSQSLVLKIGSADAYANNKKIAIDSTNPEVTPVTKNDRTLVPLRFITENFGGEVAWDESTSTIIIKTQGKVISLAVGSKTMVVDGKQITLDVPAELINGRTFIPLRQLVQDALGKKVFFSNNIIIISSTETTLNEANSSNYISSILSSFENKNDSMFTTINDSEINKTTNNQLSKSTTQKPAPMVWIKRNLPVVDFTGIAYGNGLYVIVGDRGTIYTSDDGATWSSQNSGTTKKLYDICWDGHIFVALSEKEEILTSSDGSTWTVGSIKTNDQLRSITSNGNMLIAVGAGGTILTSSDGKEWLPSFCGTTTNLNQVVWAKNKFWIAGGNNIILSSEDGKEWNKTIVGGPKELNVARLIFSDKSITAFTTGKESTSLVITNINGTLQPVMSDINVGMALVSEDGRVWLNKHVSNPYNSTIWDGNRYVSVLGTSEDLPNWSGKEFNYIVGNISKVIYNNGQYIAVGNSGTILISSDGDNWIIKSIGNEKSLYSIASNGKTLIAVGSSGISMSNGGINWSSVVHNPLAPLKYVNNIDDKFLSFVGSMQKFINSHQTISGVDVMSSTDGYTWKQQLIYKASNNLNCFARNKDIIVAVGNNGSIYTSSDGQNWARRDSDSNGSKIISGSNNTPFEDLYSVVSNGDIFVAVGNNGCIFTSDNGIKWENQSSNTRKALTDVIWTGSKFAAVGSDRTVCLSSDGINWETHTIDSDKPSLRINAIEWSGTEYMAVCESGYIYTSPDGIAWNKMDSGTDSSLYDVVWTGERYIAIGDNGIILTMDK